MSKITSWISKEDGSVEEGDLKYYPSQDGTYEIEAKCELGGILLGLDKATKQYTVIEKLELNPDMLKLRGLVLVGDILVAINNRVIIDEPYQEIFEIINVLIKGEFSKRLRFLNPRKCPIALYINQLQKEGIIMKDLLGFNCTPKYHFSEREFHASQMAHTARRDLEWVGYLKSIGGPENLKPAGVYRPSPDLKAIVRRGIPVAYRSLVWQKISLSSLHRLQYPSNYYANLLNRLDEVDQKVKDEIEKDLDRTFPEHNFFEPRGAGENGLRRVLQAFALHNPIVGYCQSLNFISGMMLLFMQEEDAFWLLVTVVERLLPDDYYTKSMVGIYVDQYVLAHIIKKCLPKIHSSFELHNIQVPLITVQWFMCIFVNTLRPEVALRVWDMFLNEGSKVLFRIAAALLKMNERRLLSMKDAADLFASLKDIGKDVIDADVLIATAYKGFIAHPTSIKMINRSHLSASSSSSASHSYQQGEEKGNSDSNHTMNGNKLRSMSNCNSSNIINNTTVSSATDIANPRLKSRDSGHGAVPADLIGIGLAHLGPSNIVVEKKSIASNCKCAVFNNSSEKSSTLSTTDVNNNNNNNNNNYVTDSYNKCIKSQPILKKGLLKRSASHPSTPTGIAAAHVAVLRVLENSNNYYNNNEENNNDIADDKEGILSSNSSGSNNTSDVDDDGDVVYPEQISEQVNYLNQFNIGDKDINCCEDCNEKQQNKTIQPKVVVGEIESTTITTPSHSNKTTITITSASQFPRENSNLHHLINNLSSSCNNSNIDYSQSPTVMKQKKSSITARRSSKRDFSFNFYRSDLALWRSSYRPALEDRHRLMETSRREWKERDTMIEQQQQQQQLQKEDEEIDKECCSCRSNSNIDGSCSIAVMETTRNYNDLAEFKECKLNEAENNNLDKKADTTAVMLS